jgi:uncharacterized membrane protein YhhN
MHKLSGIRFAHLFFFLLTIHLVSIVYGNFWWVFYTKLTIVFSLLLFLVYKSRLLSVKPVFTLAGLFLSICGDATLAFQDKTPACFIVGLACFLLAHVFYVLFYRQSNVAENFESKIKHKALWQTLIVIYSLGFCFFLSPHLASLKLPVFIYAFILMLMNSFALNRSGRVPAESFHYILAGALLFTVSDSALALNKFVGAFKYSGVFIMCTYAIAQYLITCGTISYYKTDKV